MSQTPLYQTIYQTIVDSIKNGEYPENSPLPAERCLCERYHVSRSTIRQALSKLNDDDWVYTIHGNGSFIKPQIFEQPLTKFYSFTDELKSSNILIRNDIIGYELTALDKKLADKLDYQVKSQFHKVIRLRSAKDYPLMLETTYLPRNRFVKIDTAFLKQGSLYAYLRDKYDFHVDHATEAFRPVLATAAERSLLQISSSVPCILLERFSYEDGILIEYTKSIVRGDKYVFRVDFNNLVPQDCTPPPNFLTTLARQRKFSCSSDWKFFNHRTFFIQCANER